MRIFWVIVWLIIGIVIGYTQKDLIQEQLHRYTKTSLNNSDFKLAATVLGQRNAA